MLYYRKLNLKCAPGAFEQITRIVKSDQVSWQKAIDKNGNMWNLEECKLIKEEYSILREIEEGLQCEFKKASFFLSKILPGGLVNHIDHRKWCNLLFPISGPFEESPLLFVDQFNNIVEKYEFKKNDYGQFDPIIFNTRMMHYVKLSSENTMPRVSLIMNLYDWPEDLFKKVDNKEIWKNTKNIIALEEKNK